MDIQNTSGSNLPSNVPPEILKWNWGAFLLNWIWGIGNRTFIAFLCFVPFLGPFMPFILGFKGSEWAWKNKRWESVEAFQKTQRKWAIVGLIIWGSFLVLIALAIVIPLLFGTKHFDEYEVTWKSY